MELRLHHIIHLYNVFRENDGKENCAQFIEEEFNRMFGINHEHDCNVVGMNSLNIHSTNDDCTSHDEKFHGYHYSIYHTCHHHNHHR